ncbi:alcohol dehydrogenase catalytic domain-containing protein [Arthrobacter sp. ISL-48]|uniref:alcohol dehydrogenase catalytic domain-containing protein n=1 Tax=Arthrobacter sp. ISL-48 TaxID=2819110 RepID=UPI001BE77E23|nr:alcohol dehydrogenase catalytic domain-containing protein [Arthrobacter sp. ISL-48]MBT2533965.1 alcohol dehydrogenase catalytic domain-containing protein [Arthrobacter sp. ISL-48]
MKEAGIHLDVLFAGLCGTDIQIIRGMREESAQILGHEALCAVAAIDPGAKTELVPGELVIINPTSAEDPTFLLGHNSPGVFQSRLSIPQRILDLGQVIPLKEGPTSRLAVLIEPLACVLYSLSIVRSVGLRRFVIFGDGVIGNLYALMLQRCGYPAADIRVVSRLDFDTINPSGIFPDTDTPAGVILATPRDSTLNCLSAALDEAPPGSLIDVIGGFQPPAQGPYLRIFETRASNVCGNPSTASTFTLLGGKGELSVTGHRGVSAKHLTASAQILKQDPNRFKQLLTHCVSPMAAVRYFNHLSEGGSRNLNDRPLKKLVIDMQMGLVSE